ncbi:hypothetical protein [Burkholderia sp. JKS000303]|uniref:hypothetical protein n=1 Tax=Burkholderia sp. JKS000303 TaxID=1938747 RepID=UPI0015CF0357|nr:hypothetical protein [Burkholderia sp. JKS000303]
MLVLVVRIARGKRMICNERQGERQRRLYAPAASPAFAVTGVSSRRRRACFALFVPVDRHNRCISVQHIFQPAASGPAGLRDPNLCSRTNDIEIDIARANLSILFPEASIHMGEAPGAFVSADRPTTLLLRLMLSYILFKP